jgi:hypothetical protein
VLDAILLEKAGIPTIPVITDAFDNTAKEMAELWGMPEFRFVMMPHPLASLSAADIAQRAAGLAPRVTGLLLEGQPLGK